MKKKGMLAALAAFAMLLALTIPATAVSGESGFEDDDGNLGRQAPINFDWNSFAPTTWTGTAPTDVGEDTSAAGRSTASRTPRPPTTDNGFAGGTKQDDDCATVISREGPEQGRPQAGLLRRPRRPSTATSS